ncbi:head GIN domain-containing protein [Undibacterium sp. Di26W]|uniref:head GIN domain-containing protein n=1 Tax=Undibacterium sp. Di26W TaxID=3413035 RepID=UPI003BF27250
MDTLFSRRHILGAMLVLASLPAAADWSDGWFRGKAVAGSGNIQKQDRAATGFTEVDLALPAKMELRQGDKEGIQIETDDNLQSLIETVVERGRLKIRLADKNKYPVTKSLNIVVFFKNLEQLSVGGSGKVWSDKILVKDLQVAIGGSGDIQLKTAKADTIKVNIGGSGNFLAAGQVSDFSGSIGGSGNIHTGKLEAQTVKIKIGGSGTAEVWAKDSLDASIGGSGDVTYYGDPKIKKSIGGSGSVTRKGI